MAFTEKYVTAAGAGSHDGSSESNAWTFAEMIAAAPSAGTRVNMKSGSYSIGTTTLIAGTAAALFAIRGYNATIGDLDNLGRNADGTLNTTNMPDVTITGLWTPAPFSVIQNLNITGALSSALISSSSVDDITLISCKVVNTQNNAAARCVVADDRFTAINCDFECTGAAHSNLCDSDVQPFYFGCRFKGVDTDALVTLDSGIVNDCVFIGTGKAGGNTGVVIQLATSITTFVGCTFYNLTTAISWANVANTFVLKFINCHCTDCGEFINSLYSATANITSVEVNNRTRDNTTHSTGVEAVTIGEVTTDSGGAETDFVNAGAGNFRLIATAPGKGMGMMSYKDIGAYQRQESASSSSSSFAFVS